MEVGGGGGSRGRARGDSNTDHRLADESRLSHGEEMSRSVRRQSWRYALANAHLVKFASKRKRTHNVVVSRLHNKHTRMSRTKIVNRLSTFEISHLSK